MRNWAALRLHACTLKRVASGLTSSSTGSWSALKRKHSDEPSCRQLVTRLTGSGSRSSSSSPGPNGALTSRYVSLNPGTRASRSNSVREAWYSELDADPALFTTELDATGVDDDGVGIIGDDAPLDVTESSVIVDASRSKPGRRGARAAMVGDAPARPKPERARVDQSASAGGLLEGPASDAAARVLSGFARGVRNAAARNLTAIDPTRGPRPRNALHRS